MNSRFGRGTLVIVGVGAALLSIGLAEFSLRWFSPENLSQGVSLKVKQDLPGLLPEILYERDALGLRRLSLDPSHKKPDAIRVLCIGASTTDQPTQDTSNTWCGLLQVRLAEQFKGKGIEVETASFAQGGWRMPDLLARVATRLDTLKPDIVTILMGINDLSFNGGPEYSYEGMELRVASILRRDLESRSGIQGRCEALSYLCKRVILLRNSFYEWRHKTDRQSLEWHSRNLPILRREYQQYKFVESPQRNPDPIFEFEDGINGVLELVDARGIDAIVLGQPVLWKANMSDAERAALWFFIETPEGRVRPSGHWLVNEMNRFNVAQRVIARKHNARFLDLDELIPKDLDHYFDDCHFTDLGSQRVAEVVFPEVAAAVEARLLIHGHGRSNSRPDNATGFWNIREK